MCSRVRRLVMRTEQLVFIFCLSKEAFTSDSTDSILKGNCSRCKVHCLSWVSLFPYSVSSWGVNGMVCVPCSSCIVKFFTVWRLPSESGSFSKGVMENGIPALLNLCFSSSSMPHWKKGLICVRRIVFPSLYLRNRAPDSTNSNEQPMRRMHRLEWMNDFFDVRLAMLLELEAHKNSKKI